MLNNRTLFYFFCFITALAILASCGNNSGNNEDQFGADSLLSKKKQSDTVKSVSEETMNDIIQSIPSPIEMSSLIKETGNDYNSKILNSADNVSNYTTNNKKAFAIGVYGGDLGYINIYEKTYSAINYLNAIKSLADDIKVGQFFDFSTLKRLAKSNRDVDSLLYISTTSFNDMDEYLRQQKRSNLSVLMAYGAWLESLYITTQVAKEKPNPNLFERIGEQKPVLDNLLLIMSIYKDDPFCSDLIKGFDAIKNEYESVSIVFEYQKPETKEINGELVIVDKSRSIVNITEQQVASITKVIEEVRNKAIQ